ncbi:IS1/IS1595 family N-terminal zinc-binding domain-containing protein [Scytonema millei]
MATVKNGQRQGRQCYQCKQCDRQLSHEFYIYC